ncbi:hypothetical protein [Sulfitobacter sp. R18_1]|uniref:hypothetical protein n=1 Tax=Sulfitobacter sp. R18_1 TaxID=2821104 RepID=UPI001ADBF852|nr:hypothetical protein [Sulfitobacter sp. R18_1]MBO9428281.1 hypothetical protein [Sulfitobacter sp. R18_1]
MAYANEKECEAAGLDPREVEAICRRLERAGKDAAKLGMHVFGGSGSGSLRFETDRGPLVVANMLGGSWDGGDGGTDIDEDGFLRGEFK